MRQKLIAEFIGTLILVTVVVGSGIMGDKLSADAAVSLLANTGATAAALFVLISVIGPISGAHFNPVVSAVMAARGALSRTELAGYICVQIVGGVCGVWLAHLMFDQPVLQISHQVRAGSGQFIAEILATFCLLSVILFGIKQRETSIATLVSLTIASAYWFTASTSFANPAVTIARSLTDTFAGISPANVLLFIVAQSIGATIAFFVSRFSD